MSEMRYRVRYSEDRRGVAFPGVQFRNESPGRHFFRIVAENGKVIAVEFPGATVAQGRFASPMYVPGETIVFKVLPDDRLEELVSVPKRVRVS